MAGQCKSCLSIHRDVIDDRLSKGESIDKISEWLKGMGELISPPSLLRHRKNHIAAMCLENNKTGRFIGESTKPSDTAGVDLSLPFIDTAEVITRIARENTDTNIFTSVIEARKFTQLLMERIVQNQLVIVHELQLAYTAGTSGYPDSQIRGLKTILDITNALPTYADKNILRKLSDSNEEQYVEKIRSNALEKGKIEVAAYGDDDWFCLNTKYHHTKPYDYIESLAVLLHPIHTKNRKEWMTKMEQYWNDCFMGCMPSEYKAEKRIWQYIDDYIEKLTCLDPDLDEDVYDKLSTRHEKRIIEMVIARFKSPFDAINDETLLSQFLSDDLNTQNALV